MRRRTAASTGELPPDELMAWHPGRWPDHGAWKQARRSWEQSQGRSIPLHSVDGSQAATPPAEQGDLARAALEAGWAGRVEQTRRLMVRP